jgi:ubiquinone/menaquinone biosynthesis C-methylase UbiE
MLERFLTKKRAQTAIKLIPHTHGLGKVLDIGCGTYPYFLLNTGFSEKHGIDKYDPLITTQFDKQKIYIKNMNLGNDVILPYDNNYFDVITMLAVFEHFERDRLTQILYQVRRVLKTGGLFIVTVPAGWADKILTIMATFNLIRSDLFSEHKDVYTHKKVISLLHMAGFQTEKMRFGYFEMYMNFWVMAIK